MTSRERAEELWTLLHDGPVGWDEVIDQVTATLDAHAREAVEAERAAIFTSYDKHRNRIISPNIQWTYAFALDAMRVLEESICARSEEVS